MIKKHAIPLIIVMLAIVACLPLVLYFSQFHVGLTKDPNDWGNFGNLFAGCAGLLAFVGLLLSLQITRTQFRIQSEETTFFHLINIHLEKVKNISVNKKERYNAFEEFVALIHRIVKERLISMGRFRYVHDPVSISDSAVGLFGQYMSKFERYKKQKLLGDEEYFFSIESKKAIVDYLLKREKYDRDEVIKTLFGFPFPPEVDEKLESIGLGYFLDIPITEKRDFLRGVFESFYDTYGHYYGHYFRSMHHILRYIRKTRECEEYRKIFRAQLSRFEIAALFYNYMSDYAGSEFVKNVYEMNMFEGGIFLTDLFFTPSNEAFQALIQDQYEKKAAMGNVKACT
jgi:hypothetical protein